MYRLKQQQGLPLAVRCLVLGALLLVAACGGRETVVQRGNQEQVLHIGNLSEPKDLDPHTVTGVSEFNIINALLEGLVAADPRTLDPVPGVAQSWELLEDGHRYRFHLRPDARWSNGDPVTSDDFVFSYQRILSPGLGAPYAYMLYPLEQAEAYHRGQLQDFSKVGVQAPDPHTLDLILHTPIPHFLSKLIHAAWYPVHPGTILAHGNIDSIDTGWTHAGSFVGNGPFVIQDWTPNQKISVRKNPTYWDHETVKLQGIVFYPIGDHTIEERAFRAGQLHITGTIPVDRIQHYRQNQPEILHIEPYLGTYYYLFNVQRPPLDNPDVRRALALAINRKTLTEAITRAGEEPALHFTPPNTGGYTANAKLTGTPDDARRLLAEAGFPGGKDFPTLTLLYNTADTHARIAQAIQQMWLTELGIRIELVNMDWKVYLDNTQRQQFDIARAGWIGDYLDPETFLNLWVTDGGNNRTGWSNPQYDRLIQQAATTASPQTRYNLFQQAEAILMQQAPILPLYFYRSKSLVHPAVQGWHPNLRDQHPWKHIQINPQ